MTKKPDPELLKGIRHLVELGYTASQIAIELHMVSRNAVIGMCHRNGIDLGGKKRGAYTRKLKPAPKPVKLALVKEFVTIPNPEPPEPVEIMPPTPSRRRQMSTCCWSGCMNETVRGKPYCVIHSKVSVNR
jgi:hypothetical protein